MIMSGRNQRGLASVCVGRGRACSRVGLALVLMALLSPANRAEQAPPRLDQLTLRQKIGQMFMMGAPGYRLKGELQKLIEEDCLGGVFLQGASNFFFLDQLAAFCNEMQSCALASHGIPLFIATDQEGGIGQHVNQIMGATATPGNMALGAIGSPEAAYQAYAIMGRELRAVGMNMSYSPVLDQNLAYDCPDMHVRSFGTSPNLVAKLAAAAIRGFQDHGIVPTAKHFPGYGLDVIDPHVDTPICRLSREEIYARLIPPYRAVIEAGADGIMTAHTLFEALDPDRPATLSRDIVSGILRKELGYERLVVADSITMGGISKRVQKGEDSVLAVKAGVDVIVQCPRSPDDLRDRIRAVQDAVERGEIPLERIDQSLRRILEVKEKYRLFAESIVDPGKIPDVVGTQASRASARELALRAATLVRNETRLIPLSKGQEGLVVFSPSVMMSYAGKDPPERVPLAGSLGDEVKRFCPSAQVVKIDSIISEELAAYCMTRAREAECIVFGACHAYVSPNQASLVQSMASLKKPMVVVSLTTPYDLAKFPEVQSYLCMYSATRPAVEASARVLFGEAKAEGHLPVEIPGLYPVGHGL